MEGGSYTAKVLDAVEGMRRYASDMYSKYWTGEQQQRGGGDSQGGSGPAEVGECLCSTDLHFMHPRWLTSMHTHTQSRVRLGPVLIYCTRCVVV